MWKAPVSYLNNIFPEIKLYTNLKAIYHYYNIKDIKETIMAEEENNIIEITDEEGNTLKCKLYDIIEYENKQYAVLLEAEIEDDEAEMVLMRYMEEDGESIFETIVDDEEFEKVSAYIESLEDEEDEE